MGLDLNIHPTRVVSGSGLSLTVIRVVRNDEMFTAIRALKPQQIPPMIRVDGVGVELIRNGYHEGERTFGKFDRDPYGEVYTWVRADDLARVMTAHIPDRPETAYVRVLPPDQMVILGWC